MSDHKDKLCLCVPPTSLAGLFRSEVAARVVLWAAWVDSPELCFPLSELTAMDVCLTMPAGELSDIRARRSSARKCLRIVSVSGLS